MNRLCSIALFLCIVLLLGGCRSSDPKLPPESTGQDSAPTAAVDTQGSDPTQLPSDPSQPSTPEATDPSPSEPETTLSWRTDTPDVPSYETHMEADYIYAGSSNNTWYLEENGQIYSYTLKFDSKLRIMQGSAIVYTVPCQWKQQDVYILSANGQYGWFLNRKTSEVLRMDLLTGESTVLYQATNLMDYDMGGRYMLYLADLIGETLRIYRIYLPTGKTDLVYDAPFKLPCLYPLSIQAPSSTLGILYVFSINPAMHDLLMAEFRNENSTLQYLDGYNLSRYWTDPSALDVLDDPDLVTFCSVLQERTGVNARIRYHIHADGSVTFQTGIVDNCLIGTGMPHDHYNPNGKDGEPPELFLTSWEDLSYSLPGYWSKSELYASESYSDEYSRLLISNGLMPGTLYIRDSQGIRRLTDTPMMAVEESSCYLYGITADNRVVLISYDGKYEVTLYTAQYGTLSQLGETDGYLLFADGDKLIYLDIPKKQYRVLTELDSIVMFYLMDGHSLYFLHRPGFEAYEYQIDLKNETFA